MEWVIGVVVAVLVGALGVSYGRHETIYFLRQAQKAGKLIMIRVENGKPRLLGGAVDGIKMVDVTDKLSSMDDVFGKAAKKDEPVH